MRTDTTTTNDDDDDDDDVRRCRRRWKRRSTAFVTASVLAVVFATCPTACNGASTVSPLFVWTPASESLRDDVRALRCYAAVAKEANRILVLSDFGSSSSTTNPALGSALAGVVATPSAVTNFVVPSFAGGTTWREWRNGDDVRMKKRDTRWCLELAEGTNATEAVEALGKRYRNDRPACARLSTRASETCGDDVEMVLTSKVDSMETLPDGLLEMLSDGSVKRNVVANALSEHMASKEKEKDAEDAASNETTRDGESEPAPQPESASTSTSSASSVDAESSLAQVVHRAHRASQVERVHMNERVADAGMPKFEYSSASPRLVSKSKSADASRALIFFGLSVAVVGVFINSFGFAHQARRRDELAALIIDPTRVKIEATQSPRRDERV